MDDITVMQPHNWQVIFVKFDRGKQLEANFMNPFLKSIIKILDTMAQMQAKPQAPFVKKDKKSIGDVTGIIGMASEQASGSMAISFTEPAILEIASRLFITHKTKSPVICMPFETDFGSFFMELCLNRA